MSFIKSKHTVINGRKAKIIEHCYKYHMETHVLHSYPTKVNDFDNEGDGSIVDVKICDSVRFDTIYKK